MRRLAEAYRRHQARGALARADLPEPVRRHLSTPTPPGRLPWRQVAYTVQRQQNKPGEKAGEKK